MSVRWRNPLKAWSDIVYALERGNGCHSSGAFEDPRVCVRIPSVNLTDVRLSDGTLTASARPWPPSLYDTRGLLTLVLLLLLRTIRGERKANINKSKFRYRSCRFPTYRSAVLYLTTPVVTLLVLEAERERHQRDHHEAGRHLLAVLRWMWCSWWDDQPSGRDGSWLHSTMSIRNIELDCWVAWIRQWMNYDWI